MLMITLSPPRLHACLQMFALLTLQSVAPYVADMLVREGAEAATDDKQVLPSPSSAGGDNQHAKVAKSSAGTSAGKRIRSLSGGKSSAVSSQGQWQPKQLEDVEEKEMLKELVSCDICRTSIANLHR